jgi:hypothetical protein
MSPLSFWCYVGVQNFISQMRSYQQDNNLTNTVSIVHFISLCHINYSTFDFKSSGRSPSSLCINFFHLLAPKPNLDKISIYSNKFFHIFHLSEIQFYLSQALGKWVSAKTEPSTETGSIFSCYDIRMGWYKKLPSSVLWLTNFSILFPTGKFEMCLHDWQFCCQFL